MTSRGGRLLGVVLAVAGADTGTVDHFTTADDGTIPDYGEDESDDPDYRVRTSEDAFFALLNASDPAAEFDRQYAGGDVRIDGVGIDNTVTVEAVKVAVWVGRTLGLF